MEEHDNLSGARRALVVVPLPAEIDISNAGAVGGQLRAALAPGVRVVVADLTSTVFCDSAGLRNLLLAHYKAVTGDAELRLAVTGGAVLRVLELMGIPDLIPVYPSLAAAVTARDAAR